MYKIATKKLKNPAPMPKKEDEINRSMKLYTYLVCMSGVAAYPENTRMFRQKNLCWTKINKATGITDKTIKKYIYQLESEGLIIYQGNVRYLDDEEIKEIEDKLKGVDKNKPTYQTKYDDLYGAALMKKRNQLEKNGVYHIPRPHPWTPIPEETLQKLNENFACSELEMKMYLTFVNYQDLCVYQEKDFCNITFEGLRDTFGYSKSSITDGHIRRSLIFLKGLGLIDWIEGSYANRKGAAIPYFKLLNVNYYIEYETQKIQVEIDKGVDEDFVKAYQRILDKDINSFEIQEGF